MKRSLLIAISIFFLSLSIIAQPTVIKKRKVKEINPAKIGVGLGVTRSVLYLSRNIKEQNDATGYSLSFTYHTHKSWRFCGEITRFNPINIEPTWENIKAYCYELNAQLFARFDDSQTLFYPMFGVSYNTFEGYFTGVGDFMNLKEFYKIESTVKTNWLGGNIGAGIEHNFKNFTIFGTYRMRLGKMERKNQFNIMDVCYGAGIRYDIKLPDGSNIYKGTRGRYGL